MCKSGGVCENHAVEKGTISALARRQRKTKKTLLDLAGRRTFRLDADWLAVKLDGPSLSQSAAERFLRYELSPHGEQPTG